MLEKNYKVHCSLNDQEVPEDLKIKDIVDQVRALTQFQQIHFVSLSLEDETKFGLEIAFKLRTLTCWIQAKGGIIAKGG